MTLKILYAGAKERWSEFNDELATAFRNAGVNADLATEHAPETVDYIVYAPNGPIKDFSPFTQLKAVLNLWAGVDTIVGNPTLRVPLTRMVDSGLREGMVEYVTGHVLRYHLGLDALLKSQSGEWNPVIPPLARHRTVGILGLGELGRACGEALAQLNFNVAGWSRREKWADGITCFNGESGLEQVLSVSEIIVLLLPNTPATESILNKERLAIVPKGAVVINPGRGTLIDDDALLEALASGHVSHATLDVFRTEPLPADHPYWGRTNVTVTPHIASETRTDTSSAVIAENIRRNEAGETMLYLVDRTAGY